MRTKIGILEAKFKKPLTKKYFFKIGTLVQGLLSAVLVFVNLILCCYFKTEMFTKNPYCFVKNIFHYCSFVCFENVTITS